MEAAKEQEAVVPMEVYRLKAPGLAITFRRRTGEVTLEITGDSELFSTRDNLPGTYVATAVSDHTTGIRADARLSSEVNRKVTLTLLLPEIQWETIDMKTVDFDGIAVVTVYFYETYMTDPYPQHRYQAQRVEGVVSMEV